MNEIEKSGERIIPPEYAEGARYLDMIGLGESKWKMLPGQDKPFVAFLEFCGDDARKFFFGLEVTDPNSAEYEAQRNSIVAYLKSHLEEHVETQQT